MSSLVLLFLLGNTVTAQQAEPNAGHSDSSNLSQRMARLERLLREQDDRLSHQERLLQQQRALVHQLEVKLSYQEDLTEQQGLELSRQKSLVNQFRSMVQQLNSEKVQCLQQLSPESDKAQAMQGKIKEQSSNTVDDAGSSKSTSVNVMPRSDDPDPLTAVMDQVTQRVNELGADLQALKDKNEQQDSAIREASTSTFIRWGRSQCGEAAELVYSGVMGGSWYLDSGAAVNYLCLTLSPVSLPFHHSARTNTALLYGAEFQVPDAHQDKDPVCSVCRSSSSTTVMIPGTNVCTPGWHLQYSGYLMASYHGYEAGTEYICVDSTMETRMGGSADRNGKLLDYTLTRCGSLPCQPYVNNTVVTCAVCSK